MVTKLPNLSTISGVSRFFLNNRNIAICILLNTIVIFLLSFHRFQYVLLPLDVAFTIFFIIEMIIKIKYFGKTFFKDKECVFDLSIVVISTIPLFGLFSLDWIQVMRLTRIFKSLRLFELIPNYKKLLINFKLVVRSCVGILVGLSILISGIFIAAIGIGFEMKASFLAFGIIIYILPVVVQRVSELQNPANDKDYVYLQTISTLGATNWQKFRYVYFPYVMQRVSTDVINLTAISYTYIVIAETLNKEGGIGALINIMSRQSRTAEVYALLFLIIAIGIFQDVLLKKLDVILFPSKYNKPSIKSKIMK